MKRGKTEYIFANQYKLLMFSPKITVYTHTIMRYPILNSYYKVHIECSEESTDLQYTHQILDACPWNRLMR